MLRKIQIILFLFLFAGCYSSGLVRDVSPNQVTGCGEYVDAEWEKCMETTFDQWQNRANAPLVKETLSVTRKGFGTVVTEHIRVCRADFCSEYLEDRNSPAWYHTWGQGILIATLSGGAGYFIGKTALQIAFSFLLI